MSKAIKIAKPGFNVKTARLNELVFNSDFPLFKIHKQGSGHKVVNGTSATSYVIHHDVGKIPMYFVRGEYMVDGNTKSTFYKQYPIAVYFGLGQYGQIKVDPDVDKLTIHFSLPGVGLVDIHFDFFIFEDPILL